MRLGALAGHTELVALDRHSSPWLPIINGLTTLGQQETPTEHWPRAECLLLWDRSYHRPHFIKEETEGGSGALDNCLTSHSYQWVGADLKPDGRTPVCVPLTSR